MVDSLAVDSLAGGSFRFVSEPQDSEIVTGPGLDAFRGRSRVERALLPYLREPTLWPVFAVLLAHVVLLVSPMLVIAWQDPHGWSLFGLFVLAAPSAWGVVAEIRAHGRPRLLSVLIVVTWAICVVGAWLAVWMEFL